MLVQIIINVIYSLGTFVIYNLDMIVFVNNINITCY